MSKNHFIKIGVHQTRYWEAGTKDNAPTVILLHGFALSCEIWKENIAQLSHHFHVVALDVLGFGQSDVPNETVLPTRDLPKFIHSFMQALQIKKAHVIGHSMGGLIAVKLATFYPNCVEKLILVGAAGFKRDIPMHFRLYSLPFFGEMMSKPNKTALRHALKHNVYLKNTINDALVETLYEFTKDSPKRMKYYLSTCRAAMNFFGFKNYLLRQIKSETKTLKTPTLILWGRQDPILNLSHGVKAHKLIKTSKLVVFEQCGHLPQLEYPESFNEHVLQFLKEQL